MKLNFQFDAAASDDSREKVRAKLKDIGVKEVRPLFPGEADAELAALQVVEVAPGRSKQVLNWLREQQDVAFAEETAPRYLVK
jgi:hypothetical protein